MQVEVTPQQMRKAILDALSGRIQPQHGVRFDNYINLKIGVRAALAREGILEPQLPVIYPADSALTEIQERTYKKTYDALKNEGVITEKHGSDQFFVELLPAPFSQRWQYVESLRGGGQGKTIKVSRLIDGVSGVLKVPHFADETATKRFMREVHTLGSVSHPSIVVLLESNLDPALGSLGYVTPLGRPLDEYWNNQTKLLKPNERYDRAFEIIHRLAEGLASLHAKGVVHRDIKPENVVVIDDRPVLIDFGVVLRPGDDRLSIVEGRPVANGFATPVSAHYGLHNGGTEWDCLGLAWLYGFLIGEGRRPKQFHWKFHPLVEEPRKDRARAVLAACSHESTVPTDANAFMELMDRFNLNGKSSPRALSADERRAAAAAAAHIEAKAASALRWASSTELSEVSIQIIEGPLEELRTTLNRLCVARENLPVQQNVYVNPLGSDPLEMPPMPARPMRDILHQITKKDFATEHCIFSCSCGGGLRKFLIGVFVSFTVHHVEDGLPFHLNMWCRYGKEKGPEWPDLSFNLRKDGAFACFETGKVLDAAGVAKIAYEWMTEPFRWTFVAE